MRLYLLKYTEGAEELIAAGGYATSSQKSAAKYKPTKKEVNDMVKFALDMNLSSILDFPYYVFAIEGVSRSFTHQWVRYRLAAHMQQSLRYTKINPEGFDWFVIPPSILKKGSEAIIDYINNQQETGKFYKKYVKEGIPKEDSRFGLPIGVKTHISSAFDAEEYLHIINQRTCLDAQWEIRSVANAAMLAGMIVHPRIFKGAGPSCISEGKCTGRGHGRCEEDALEIKKQLKKLKNKFKPQFENLPDGEEIKIDLTEILGYEVLEETKQEVWEEFGERFNLDREVELIVRKNWRPKVKGDQRS